MYLDARDTTLYAGRLMFVLYILYADALAGQSLIINHHSVSAFDSIPEEYKQAATNLRMLFMDRSVGFNISNYLDCLSQPWDSAPTSCKRAQHQDSVYAVDPSEVYWDGTWNRSSWRYEFWPTNCSEDVTCFIDFMQSRLDSFDVFGCQFSYLAVLPGSNIADPVTGFFGGMGNDNKASTYAAFEAANPDKKVIWWTTSLARGIGTPESESFNDQLREYAATHDIILFDVADILSHDPAGEPCFDNRDGITYRDENHPDDGLDIPAICPQYTTETEGGHLGSISAGGVRVSKAFWVLMARIAGWDGVTTHTDETMTSRIRLFPNPTQEYIALQIENGKAFTSCDVRVVDIQGREYYHAQIPLHETEARAEIPLPGLTSGIYLVRVDMADRSHIMRCIVH